MLCEGCKELIVTIVSKGWAEQVIQAALADLSALPDVRQLAAWLVP